MYKNTKWAQEILSLQNENGFWGYFHTLSEPTKFPITTEQALRRLLILGYDINDNAIAKAVTYMSDCLNGTKELFDRREKTHNWDIFTEMMLSTWIRKFTLSNTKANEVAAQWADIITNAFASGEYNRQDYITAYTNIFHEKPRGGRLVDFVSFYQVSLLSNTLDSKTERLVFDYILTHQSGIYYMYGTVLTQLPSTFASKEASRYLGVMELLADYKHCIDKLAFVAEWLKENQDENETWDMGSKASDKIYFPLSDNWRTKGSRELDCTYRISKLLKKLS